MVGQGEEFLSGGEEGRGAAPRKVCASAAYVRSVEGSKGPSHSSRLPVLVEAKRREHSQEDRVSDKDRVPDLDPNRIWCVTRQVQHAAIQITHFEDFVVLQQMVKRALEVGRKEVVDGSELGLHSTDALPD